MTVKNNRVKKFTLSDVRTGFICSSVCGITVMLFGAALIIRGGAFGMQLPGFFGVALGAAVLLYSIFTMHIRKKRVYKYMHEYSFCVDAVTRTAIENFVHPVTVINDEGEIIWSNDRFLRMIDRDSHYGEYIQDVFTGLAVDKYIESDAEVIDDFEFGGHSYVIHGRSIESADEGISLAGLYFVDVTEIKELRQLAEDNRAVQCLAVIDNYDEVIKETPNSNHGALMGEIERRINAWVASGNGVVRRFERERFIIFFRSREYHEIIEKRKYSILADIRSINLENKIPVTLSIGTGIDGETFEENNNMSVLALDMALGRGGDQVVVKSPSAYKFYGAKSREVEKSTKVKARVVAHAMRKLIDDSSKVIIMGHKNSDMDSMGAAIGLCRAIRTRGGDAYIAVKRNSTNAAALLDGFEDNPEYDGRIIGGDKAMNILDKNTLLIVVDTHRHSMVEFVDLLDAAKSVVLIDHHRRSEDFIDKAVLTYHEPYASSACEMVTEILQYIQDNPKIDISEAEALYAGIFLDTKGFTFKTGVRTFEAAAYLRRLGVNPVSVQRLFKSDINESVMMSKIIGSVKVYRDGIAIASSGASGKEQQVIAAKAADELLNIAGIEASFVLARVGHKISISARSIETINVQLVMERLGGGGHITIAGAQLPTTDIEYAEERLKAAIDEVMDE